MEHGDSNEGSMGRVGAEDSSIQSISIGHDSSAPPRESPTALRMPSDSSVFQPSPQSGTGPEFGDDEVLADRAQRFGSDPSLNLSDFEPFPLSTPIDSYSSLERNLWLKACLILQTCTKGVKPFVGMVMEQVLSRVIENVKQDVTRDFRACEIEDWDCTNYNNADDAKFTENGPVALSVNTMCPNGIVSFAKHGLKPRVLTPCRLMNIPPGCFSSSDELSSASPVLIYPILDKPVEKKSEKTSDKPDSSSFYLLHDLPKPMLQRTGNDALRPFRVSCCDPSEPRPTFHAVLCFSRRGRTLQLLKPRSEQQQSGADAELSFGFWALDSKPTADGKHVSFLEFKHGLKQGYIVSFDGDESNPVPPGIVKGRRYLITEVTDYSFNICGPIISPASVPLTSPFVVIRKSPVGRYIFFVLFFAFSVHLFSHHWLHRIH